MTIESYYLGAYWGNREESAAECGRRTAVLLRSLSGCDAVFACWFERGVSPPDALNRPVVPDPDALRTLFERGANRQDEKRSAMQELGFRISLWNGRRGDESAGLSLLCGCYGSTARVWIPNSCVLDLPSQGPASDRVLRVGVLEAVLQCPGRPRNEDPSPVGSAEASGIMPRTDGREPS